MRQWWPAVLLVTRATLFGSLMIERLFNRVTFQPQPGEPAAAAGFHVPVEDIHIDAVSSPLVSSDSP